MKVLLESLLFLIALPAGLGLIYGAHGVLDRVAPSWLAMGIAEFATMFVAFFLTARASAPVLNGVGRGAVMAAIASFFIVQPDGSGVAAGAIGMLLGIVIGMLASRRGRSEPASAPAPGPYRAVAHSAPVPGQAGGACEFCRSEGLVGIRSTGGTVDYLPNDGTAPPSYVRVPCPYCGGRMVGHPPAP